jgi:hypothetical protein
MRPTREQLDGLSCSEFKTLLKRRGHKVKRNLFKYEPYTTKGSRQYRWRYWGTVLPKDETFMVDISYPLEFFDRWANSTDYTIKFREYIEGKTSDE